MEHFFRDFSNRLVIMTQNYKFLRYLKHTSLNHIKRRLVFVVKSNDLSKGKKVLFAIDAFHLVVRSPCTSPVLITGCVPLSVIIDTSKLLIK